MMLLTSSNWGKFAKIYTLCECLLFLMLFLFLFSVNCLSLSFLDEVEESVDWEG